MAYSKLIAICEQAFKCNVEIVNEYTANLRADMVEEKECFIFPMSKTTRHIGTINKVSGTYGIALVERMPLDYTPATIEGRVEVLTSEFNTFLTSVQRSDVFILDNREVNFDYGFNKYDGSLLIVRANITLSEYPKAQCVNYEIDLTDTNENGSGNSGELHC